MRRALISLSILAFTLQGCALFAGGRPIVTGHNAGCSTLLPPEWEQGVEGADLPAGAATADVGEWIVFGDAQTGRLDQANDRYKAGVGIVRRCEARDAEAVRRATQRGFLGIF